MLKRAIGNDGFLGMLHALLLMDDTILLATTRDMCEAKLKVVLQYGNEFGMGINVKKTKFFVINGSEHDKIPIQVDSVKICYSPSYLYLGAWFTESGKMKDVIALHEKANQATINKFAIFCAANTNMPFKYKKMVFDAAVTSSLLYSSESWFTNSIKPIEQQYDLLVRCLLGVRKYTSINLCLLESGIPPVSHVLAKRKCTYLRNKLDTGNADQPFISVFRLCQNNNTPAYRLISNSLGYNKDIDILASLANSVRVKAMHGTKFNTYMSELNITLNSHPIYSTNKYIPDYLRESFTRIRLMSHNLKIETGRWSRIPHGARVCRCNNAHVQTESHVLINCNLTQNLRTKYPMLNFQDINSLFGESTHMLSLCKYVHEVLNFYA